jgi:hypothetical protein
MKLSELQKDSQNANAGNQRGRDAVRTSLQRFGAGRSVLIDRHNRVVAGNQTIAQAAAAGITDVVVVETTGDKLVAVKRTDISLDDAKGRELAIADNRTSELGLSWDSDVLAELSGDLDLKPFFTDAELQDAIGNDDNAPVNDPSAEYVGMPGYTSDDQMGVRKLIVHFKTPAAVDQFAKAIGQTISPKAIYIWYPAEPWVDQHTRKYVTDPAPVPDLHSDAQPQ